MSRLSSRLRLCATLLVPLAGSAPAAPQATNPALTFFSSLSEEPFARLEAASIGPRYSRHGPFRVPAPGLAIEAPTLDLLDQPFAPEDWRRLLRDLAAWRRLPGASDFVLHLPDGRVFTFLRSPSLAGDTLSGLVRPVTDARRAPAATLLLRIAHDGERGLRIDLRPLSAGPAADAAALEAEAPAHESPPPLDPPARNALLPLPADTTSPTDRSDSSRLSAP